ncbi:Hypothetical predicted protein [Cloeon dipterum]|uniref:DNA helicase MCM9 n=1 Tax=Cloeon dipterum TaxID=197152 RepID=A0A8S1BZ16_9INSE|nr:Hypothetical predicted protein [Cloeon dipterum]
MNENDIKEAFRDFIIERHAEDLIKILRADDKVQHYSVNVNFISLFESNYDLGDSLLSNPAGCLAICDKVLLDCQALVVSQQPDEVRHEFVTKTKIHTRFSSLPACPELHRAAFPRNEDINSFLRVTGTVVRTSVSKMLEYQRIYKCKKCKFANVVKADYELNYYIVPPKKCGHPDGCGNGNFEVIQPADGLNYKDFQEIKLQEQVTKLSIGTMPRSMLVTLEDDLVDACKPGDDVVICGIVSRRWKNLGAHKRSDIELVLKANHLQVCNNQQMAVLVTKETHEECLQFWREHAKAPLQGRDLILASMCPQVFGLYIVKMATALVLAGGVARVEESGARVRGESHLLLVGDPGTAKSHILRYAARLTPRSVFTTGIGSTSAGLTVTAVMESGGDWQLEAGALVLSDGGICCIDEFNSIRENDKTSIHEAMEQQTISVAKAGLVCKLNTRCTVLAATNPKGKYDPNEPVTVNVAIASPLLSRFDLVLVLLDSTNKDWDRTVSDYILRGKDPSKAEDVQSDNLWSMERMRCYFCIIKTLNPKLTKNANQILSRYYQAQRRTDHRSAARTTVRLLESLIRLSQAHSRLMFREEVTTMDALTAVMLMEYSMLGAAILPTANIYHASFPSDPMLTYRHQATIILEKLGLPEILKQELDWLENGPKNDGPSATTSGGSSDRLEFVSQFQSNTNMQKLNCILKNIRKNRDKTACAVVDHQKNPTGAKRVWKEKPKKTQAVRGPFSNSSSSSEDEKSPSDDEEENNEQPSQQRKRIRVIESSSDEENIEEPAAQKKPVPINQKLAELRKFAFAKASGSSSTNFFNSPPSSASANNLFQPSNKNLSAVHEAAVTSDVTANESGYKSFLSCPDNSVLMPPQQTLSALEKLKKFACRSASFEPNEAEKKDPVVKKKLTPIEALAMCGKKLSQLSRASQSSGTQSPLLNSQKLLSNPFLADDDDDDIDFSLP